MLDRVFGESALHLNKKLEVAAASGAAPACVGRVCAPMPGPTPRPTPGPQGHVHLSLGLPPQASPSTWRPVSAS